MDGNRSGSRPTAGFGISDSRITVPLGNVYYLAFGQQKSLSSWQYHVEVCLHQRTLCHGPIETRYDFFWFIVS